jgi:large subunit ribosomal protein LP0
MLSWNTRKSDYAKKLHDYLHRFQRAILVNCDNVGSQQFQDIRRAIRSNSAILMGKNTLVKRCLRLYFAEHTDSFKTWGCLLDLLVGNVGIIFT